MNKRKVDLAAYTGSGALSGNLAAEVANWEACVAADVAMRPQLGVAANHCSQPNADVAREPQPRGALLGKLGNMVR